MDIAFFDFDGTITRRDTLGGFIRHAVGKPRFVLGLLWLSPVMAGYRLGFMANDASKEILMAHFFRGWSARRFQAAADRYSLEKIDRIVRPEAMARLAWHKDRGDAVAVVSASMGSWLKAWCQRQGLDLIATELEIRRGRITGRFSTPNCHGAEKVRRIRERYDLKAYGRVYAYGDSSGDRAMLDMADKPFYRGFG